MPAARRFQEGLAKEEGRHSGDENSQSYDRRRVVASKHIDPALRGSLLTLGLLHHMDDAADRVVRSQASDPYLQRSGTVDRAGEDIVPWPFLDRDALARDGGLVDRGGALGHLAIHGNPLGRLDQDDVANGQLRHRHTFLVGRAPGTRPAFVEAATGERLLEMVLAIHTRSQHDRLHWGQFHQGSDGAPRPVHRVALERLAQAEEEDYQCSLLPGSDGHRAHRSKHHQEVDVQLAIDPYPSDALAGRVVAAYNDRRGIDRVGDRRGDPGNPQDEGHQDQQTRHHCQRVTPFAPNER